MTWSYGHASLVQCQVERLTLRLSARLFDAELWATIKAWFQTDVRASHWRSAPFRVMTASEDQTRTLIPLMPDLSRRR